MKIIRIGKWVKDSWLMLGCTILLFCFLEGSLSLAFFIRNRLSASAPSDAERRVLADTYADSSWVNNYQEEYSRSGVLQWRPYVYWRRMPYHGNYINIDADGLRLTTSTEAAPQESRPPLKIFLFGGSTMWGSGVRDAFTIPSIVAKELQGKGVAAEVVNFGENGYVSTQEVITLLLQLRKGQRPDLVIFYDGVNDVYSAYQQRVAGLPQNEFNREREFNLSHPDNLTRRTRMFLRDVASSLSTVRFTRGLFRRTGILAAADSLPDRAPESEALAQNVLATYQGNIEIVKALSEHYHFNYIFYWQPTIFQKTNLTTYELRRRAEMQGIERFVQLTYGDVQQSGLAEGRENSFHDLSLIFADVREPIYIDFCHIGESGNEVIAKRMVSDILGLAVKDK